jgi:hypothetical protein
MNTYVLPYYISNNGDGSASLRICKTLKEAQKEDDKQNESEGWAEPSADEIKIIVKDGEPHIEQFDTNEKSPTYLKYILVKLEKAPEKKEKKKK